MSLLDNKAFLTISTFFGVGLLIYSVAWESAFDTRFLDGGLSISEMYWWEYPLVLSTVLIFVLWVLCLINAFKNKKIWWSLLILFVWPTVIVYAWNRVFKNAT